jgi:hypothetical protein
LSVAFSLPLELVKLVILEDDHPDASVAEVVKEEGVGGGVNFDEIEAFVGGSDAGGVRRRIRRRNRRRFEHLRAAAREGTRCTGRSPNGKKSVAAPAEKTSRLRGQVKEAGESRMSKRRRHRAESTDPFERWRQNSSVPLSYRQG